MKQNTAKNYSKSTLLVVAFLLIWLVAPTVATALTPTYSAVTYKAWLILFGVCQISLLLMPFKTLKSMFWASLPFAMVAPFYLIMTLKFNSTPGDAFLSASMHVNSTQLMETLTLAGPKVLALPILWALYIYLVAKLPLVTIRIDLKKKILASVLLVALINVTAKNFNYDVPLVEDLVDTSYPSNLVMSSYRLIKHEEKPVFSSIQGKCINEKCPSARVIFVLGESVRPDHLSLYGYARQTTPFLDSIKSETIVFKDAVATANWTVGAIPSIIYHGPEDKKASLVQTMKEAGYATAWFSNEPHYYFGEEADQSTYAESGLSLKYRYDTALLPYFHGFMKQNGKNQFIVLHTFGSHISYDSRYGQKAKKFTPTLSDIGVIDPLPKDKTATINSYDNTIVELDMFLQEVVKSVQNDEVPTVVLYLSDHGEDLFDDERNRFMHALSNPTPYGLKVPLFVWANKAYTSENEKLWEGLKSNIDKPINHNNIMPTLLSLAKVTTSMELDKKSLTNPNLTIEERYVITELGKPLVNYKSIK